MTDVAQAEPLIGVPAIIRLNADPLDWPQLPKSAKIALRRLRRARDDAWHAWRAVADDLQQGWDVRRAIEAQLKLLTGGRPDSAWYSHTQHSSFQKLPDDDLRVATELGKLEDVAAELGRLGPIVDERTKRLQQCGRLVTSVEEYLNGCGRAAAAFKVYKGRPSPRPKSARAPSMPLSVAAAACESLTPTVTGSRPRLGILPTPSGVRVSKSTRLLRGGNRASCRLSNAATGRSTGPSGSSLTRLLEAGRLARSVTRKRCRFCSGFIVTPLSRRSRHRSTLLPTMRIP